MFKKTSKHAGPESQGGGGLGGILNGLGELVDKLGELADSGRELRKSGEIHGLGSSKEVKGVYGFTVRVGLGDQGIKIEPFGNIRRDQRSGRSVVEEVREPVSDVFEEPDHVLIVAEMPGIANDNVRLDVKDDVLTVTAEHGDTKYRKEVLLPGIFLREKMQVSCANGVLEIRCVK